jgi:3-deoxy-D-manno-octulosonic-acid transferase
VTAYRLKAYRAAVRMIQKGALPFFVPKERLDLANEIFSIPDHRIARAEKSRLWFHAASVGELESLWPLIELATQGEDHSVILTVFSSSAFLHAKKMMQKIGSDRVLFAGYSPFEGDWRRALEKYSPQIFITAKYEAWPELWCALSQMNIHLSIVGAKLRPSLIFAKRVVGYLGCKLPEMKLFTFSEKNIEKLKLGFPFAKIFSVSDPRWDRVFFRQDQNVKNRQNRIESIKKDFNFLPRPWGVFGSVWGSDLREWIYHGLAHFEGTPLLVPHKTDSKSLKEIEVLIRELGFSPMRSTDTTGVIPAGRIALIVDEIGFLAELYSEADWAYIGGGFGAGVHSTIEPAVYGIPIFCGPSRAEKFDEIAQLENQGQLLLLRDSFQWEKMKGHLKMEKVSQNKKNQVKWSKEVSLHRGTSQLIWNHLVRNPDSG